LTFFSAISFGPYLVSRFCASAWVRPSGDEPSFFSTSARGRVFKSSFALGAAPGLGAVLVSAFGAAPDSASGLTLGSVMAVLSVFYYAAGFTYVGKGCDVPAFSIAAVYSPRRAARLHAAR
jgi:hypothetical protein